MCSIRLLCPYHPRGRVRTKGHEELGIVGVLLAIVGHSDQPSMGEAQTRMNLVLEWFWTSSESVISFKARILTSIERLASATRPSPISSLY